MTQPTLAGPKAGDYIPATDSTPGHVPVRLGDGGHINVAHPGWARDVATQILIAANVLEVEQRLAMDRAAAERPAPPPAPAPVSAPVDTGILERVHAGLTRLTDDPQDPQPQAGRRPYAPADDGVVVAAPDAAPSEERA